MILLGAAGFAKGVMDAGPDASMSEKIQGGLTGLAKTAVMGGAAAATGGLGSVGMAGGMSATRAGMGMLNRMSAVSSQFDGLQ